MQIGLTTLVGFVSKHTDMIVGLWQVGLSGVLG